MIFGRIDHIAVVVPDLDAGVRLYKDQFDMREQHRGTFEEQGVEAVLLEIGDSHVELVRPLEETSGVGKFLAKNGPGFHHVAYACDDIDQALAAVRDAGLQLIDKEPRRGILDSKVAFLHPKSTGGVLTELVEPAH